MDIKKGLARFMNGWVNNMKKITPVGKRPRPASAKKMYPKPKRPRPASAKKMYPKPLKDSIQYIQKAKPILQMNLYGTYVNSGHRTRGTTKLGPNPSPNGFIRPSFDQTFDEMENELPDEVFDLFNKEFKMMFDKHGKIG